MLLLHPNLALQLYRRAGNLDPGIAMNLCRHVDGKVSIQMRERRWRCRWRWRWSYTIIDYLDGVVFLHGLGAEEGKLRLKESPQNSYIAVDSQLVDSSR